MAVSSDDQSELYISREWWPKVRMEVAELKKNSIKEDEADTRLRRRRRTIR